jgi:hypothetical protein
VLAAHVRFAPKADKKRIVSACPLSAISRHMQRSNVALYSITSLARASSVAGRSRSSALAVFRLITTQTWWVPEPEDRQACRPEDAIDVARRAVELVD